MDAEDKQHKDVKMKNAMTVDVEDYFQVAAFENQVKVDDWGKFNLRSGDNTRKLLEMFSKHNVTSTFFMLGCVAERDPQLVKDIVAGGHELASHGYWHQKAFRQTPDAFFNDVDASKKLLEDLAGVEVKGYRAPSFSIDKRNEWAFDMLKKAGYTYSSSTYAVAHDHYGTPDWPTKPYMLDNGLWELPQATIEKFGKRLPVGGGGYFRLFPLQLSQWFISQFHEQHDHPYIFYFHPWEIDPEQPKIDGASAKSRFRHYVNLGKMEKKIESLCRSREWGSIAETFDLPSLAGGKS